MSSGLTHIGAIARGLAYAPAAPARAFGQATDVAVTAARPVAPVQNVAEARAQIRDQVMSERGMDPMRLFQMSSQDRIRAEVAMMVDTARRSLITQNQQRADIHATGNLIDLRV